MTQINSPMSNPVKIPKELQAILAPDEQVLQKIAYNEKRFFATTKRLIIFHPKINPASLIGCLLFGLVGALLGGIISSLTAKLEYDSHVEYPGISGITINSHRNSTLVIFGAIIGLGLIFTGVVLFSPPDSASSVSVNSVVVGVILIAVGVITVWLTCFRKFKHYQLEIPNLSKTELKKWRIPTGKRGDKFITLIQQKTGRSVG